MKNRTIRKGLRRAAALVLAVLSLVPAELLVPARAALSTTQTKLVVWDWIDDMQKIGSGADYNPDNESKNIPVNQVKYSRIMFYQNTGGDRYFFNATDRGGSDSSWYSTYDEDKIYVKSSARVGNSSHKEWNSDMIAAEGGGSFLTKSGENTPYLQYGGTKEGFHTWRLWASTSGDNWSNHAVMLVDDYEDLDVRRTDGFSSNAVSHYGAKNDTIRADCWIIDKKFVGAAAANYKYSFSNFTIWHWDNDSGGYNEAMDFDAGDTKFKAYNAGTNIGVEEFKIFLGKEYKVSTLAENFEVYADQTQTLGKPVFYIPKGKTVTVRKHATLVIDGVLLLDGRIAVEEGGLLKLKDGAKVFPLTKYDNECGQIDSSGDIVIGTGAVLCGGPNNGIRIGGGGVVNFGTLCGEYIELGKNDLVDNRVEDASQGWIIAGKSLTGAARSRFVKAAILNEDTAKLSVDRSRDFATLNSSAKGSFFSKQLYSVYGDGAANVDTSGVGKTTIGSASNPTLSVYYADTPGQKGTALFENEMLDEATLRVSGATATYTVRDRQYPAITNKLITATIGRGTDSQTLFRDMWVGDLKNAYVQLEPASAAGTCLTLSGGGTANGTNVQLGARDPNQTDKAQWWRLVEDGRSGVNRTYILQSFKDASKSLDLPGNNSAPSGANVQLWTTAGDSGTDRRWLLVADAMNRQYYRLRNAANTGVSMEAEGTSAGANVRVASNAESGQTLEKQRWRFVNLFDEESYAASLKDAAAMELIPQNATGLRLQVSGMGSGVSTRVRTADSNNLAQRWELQQAGADLLGGVNTPYFRIVNKQSQKVLTASGAYKNGASVTANSVESGSGARTQFWYLAPATGTNQYYLKSRGDSNYALSCSGTGSGSAVQISAYVKEEKSQLWEITGAAAAVNQAAEKEKEAQNDPYYGKAYELVPVKASDRKLAAKMGAYIGTTDSTALYTQSYDADLSLWSFRYAGKDSTGAYYELILAKEEDQGAALGLWSQSKIEHLGRMVMQETQSDSSRLYWRLTKNSDDTYTIKLRGNEKLELGIYYHEMNSRFVPTNSSPARIPSTLDQIPNRGNSSSTNGSATLTSSYSDYYPILVEKDESRPTSSQTDEVINGVIGKYTVNHKYDYYKTTWKLNEIVKSPLDGKAFTIESVGQPGKFVIPYGFDGNSGQSAHCAVSQGADKKSYGRWGIKQAGYEDGKPYFYIYSIHNDDLLFATLDSGSSNYIWSAGNINDMDDHYNDPKEFYYKPKFCWFIRTNSDGTYTFISRSNSKEAMEVFSESGYNRLRTAALGSTPADNQKWKLAEVDPNADYIDGKVFYLSPKHAGSDKVMDLYDNGTSNGTKVQLYDKYETEIQRWRFERAGTASKDGKTVAVYYIHSVHAPGKALDVPGGSTSNGTRPQLYDFSATNNNQKWILEDAGEGYYYIIPYLDSTVYLGVAGSSKSNNAAVELWNSSGDNRKWKLTETIAPATLGTFELESVGKADWTIDVYSDSNDSGAHLQIYPAHQRDYTRWTFVQMGTDTHDAYYKIVNKASGKVMDISGYGRENVKEGAEVLQANYDFRDDQLWYLSKGSDSVSDYYYIYNKADSYYKLAVKDSKYEKNQYIVLTSSWGDNTKWRMKQDFKPVDLGTYEFGLNDDAHANMRMDVFGGETGNGANIQVHHANSTKASTAQTFRILQRGTDLYNGEITPYYSIENTNSKKSLDPGGTAETYDNLNIGQYDYDGYSDQHWFLEVRGDDSVVFRNRNDPSLVLTANGTDDGKTVCLRTYDDKKLSTQSWRLHPIMLTSNGRYYLPGNAATAAAGIPYVEDQDVTVEPLALGKYTLTPQHAASMRMDLTAGSTGNGTKIQLYANNGGNGERWQFIPAGVDCFDGDGRVFYRLAFGSDANKVAETSGYGPVTAALDIRIWDSDGGYDQQWYLEEVGGKEDTYYLIGRGTLSQAKKICLGAPAGATASGTQLQTATLQNKTYQQWQLEPVD